MGNGSEDTANLIDLEPTIFLGCSSRELQTLAGLGLVVGLVLGAMVVLFSGIGLLLLPCLIIFPVLVVYLFGARLGKAKEGKPVGYYDRLIAARMSDFGFGKSYVTRLGHWRNRR